MSVVAAPAGPRVAPRAGWIAVSLWIGAVEGRRLVRSPFWMAAALLGLVLMVIGTWVHAPVLNRHDGITIDSLVPLAVAALILKHLAVTRSLRHGTTDLVDSTPTGVQPTTAGHVLSLVHAFGFTLVLVVSELAYLKAVGGVGTPRLLVMLVGPTLVVLSGAIGVALGRFLPHVFVGPLAIVALVAASAGLLNSGSLQPRRLADAFVPYLPGDHWGQALGELSVQRFDAHLAYLVALIVLASGIAFLRHGRHPLIIVAVSIGLIGAFVFARERHVPSMRPVELAAASEFMDPEAHRVCETRSGVRYCAYPDYTPWIDPWAEVVTPILQASGAEAPSGFAVTQLPADHELWGSEAYFLERHLSRASRNGELGSEQEVHPGMQWGRNVAEGESQLGLGLGVALRMTGFDTRFFQSKAELAALPEEVRKNLEPGPVRRCASFGQARAIVALWLAAQATPETREAFERAAQTEGYSRSNYFLEDMQSRVVGSQDRWVAWGVRETEYARQLLRRDPDEVRALVQANWDRLVDPTTSSGEAAALLGLEPARPARSAAVRAGWSGLPLCR